MDSEKRPRLGKLTYIPIFMPRNATQTSVLVVQRKRFERSILKPLRAKNATMTCSWRWLTTSATTSGEQDLRPRRRRKGVVETRTERQQEI